MKFLVDVHEDEKIQVAFGKYLGEKNQKVHEIWEFEVVPLPIGDVVLPEKSLVIERKEIGDFWTSLTEGRLFEQATNMMQNFQNRHIIVIGKFDELYFSGVKHTSIDAYEGALTSLCVKYGVIPHKVDNKSQFVKKCVSLMEKTGEVPDLTPIKRLTYSSEDRRVASLTAFEGINTSSARKLMEFFGNNMKALVEAPEEKIKEIEGFGDIKAAKLRKNLDEWWFGIQGKGL